MLGISDSEKGLLDQILIRGRKGKSPSWTCLAHYRRPLLRLQYGSRRTIFGRPGHYISSAAGAMEDGLGLNDGTLERDDEEVSV